MVWNENFEIRLLCCGAGEGELCACMEKYRSKTAIPIGEGQEFYPVDFAAWLTSEDFYGYLAIPKGAELSDSARELIKTAAKEVKLRGYKIIALPGVSFKNAASWDPHITTWDQFVRLVYVARIKAGEMTIDEARNILGLVPVEDSDTHHHAAQLHGSIDTSDAIIKESKSTKQGWRPSSSLVFGALALLAATVRNRD